MGRPNGYSPEIADEICERLADGESLRRICQDDHIPSRETVRKWLSDPARADFLARCARAREEQGDLMDEKILDVAEKVLSGEIDSHAGKVAISAYQWRASKLAPKVYGDSLKVTGGGPNESVEVTIRSATDEP